MTAARQERKLFRRIRAAIVAAAMMPVSLAPAPAPAATTELIVANRHTGLAIDGFDPVAYFFGSVPVLGRAELELRFAGATWRFRNEGNRAAFAAHPEVYMPRLGGYDPIAAARGAATPGHPDLWIVASGRLYLFHSTAARDSFADNPEQAIDAADRSWPEIVRTLSQ